jgi:hypothetical protein
MRCVEPGFTATALEPTATTSALLISGVFNPVKPRIKGQVTAIVFTAKNSRRSLSEDRLKNLSALYTGLKTLNPRTKPSSWSRQLYAYR